MSELTNPDQALEARIRQAQEQADKRYQQLCRNARATYRAMEGWRSGDDTPEDWQRICEESRQDYQSGQFLIDRLGAERYLDPPMMAVLWQLRQALLDDGTVKTTRAADMMLADLTVLSYYNALRIQGWIGNLALLTEHELFSQESPTAKFRQKYGRVEGLRVEDYVRRLSEQLLPLLERANRMVIRSIKALRDLLQAPVPPIAIGRAEQVNVANQQVNTTRRD